MRIVLASLLVLASIALIGAAPTAAAGVERTRIAPVSELSSQDVRPRRARTRIRVTPARRLFRQCDFRLVREVSVRGTYIVPHQRCWWVRG
jgi:hypothetical protein